MATMTHCVHHWLLTDIPGNRVRERCIRCDRTKVVSSLPTLRCQTPEEKVALKRIALEDHMMFVLAKGARLTDR